MESTESPALAALRELLAEKNRLLEGAAKIDAAISEATPPVVAPSLWNPVTETTASEPPKPGIRSSEMWLAALLPLIVGAVVQLGWLSEQAATELGMVGGGSYVLGRSLVKSAMEWRKR